MSCPITINKSWNTNCFWWKFRCWWEVWGVYLELSKAFDEVWHDGLLYKSKAYGVQSEPLSLLRKYLQKCKKKSCLKWSNFRVERNHFWSTKRIAVRTSSIISLHKWSTNWHNFIKQIFYWWYILSSKVRNITKSVNELNADLERISKRAYQWKM